MFERFTEQARQVVVLAQEEARALGHNYIGTEHLLLGLLREEDAIAARVLASFGITVERARGRVVAIVGSSEEVTGGGQIPFTPRAKKVLELALREALSLGHDYIGTEHILLGVVRENEGVAARILLDYDAQSERVHTEVLRHLSAPVAQRLVPLSTRPRRAPNPLRPPLDWERAGILWRPDRILRGTVRELERLAVRVLEQQLGLRVSRARPRPGPVHRPPIAPPRVTPGPHRVMRPPAQGLVWSAATLLWRPEGLELRVPLRLDESALAAFAADEVWQAPPLAGLRREIWTGWLALASPTLLDDADPGALRGALEAAVTRARGHGGAEPGRVEDFLRRLRG